MKSEISLRSRLRPKSKRQAAMRRMMLWLFALGFVVRFLYFVEHSSSAFYQVPILDEAFYDTVARALNNGDDISAINPAFRPLLYPALLAAAYEAGGSWGWSLALAGQHLLGIVTALLIALIATRLFARPAAGVWAGALYLLAGPPLFFEGELLIVSLFTALGALLLAWLSTTRLETPPWRWLVAGILVGLMAQARANALILAAAFPLAAMMLPGAATRLRRGALVGLALGGLLLSLVTFASWQSPHIGRFQLVPGAGGVNLYLGNKQGADGMVPRQDRATSYGDTYQDSVQLFALEVYREKSGDSSADPEPAKISRFWLHQTVAEITADPVGWTLLMARKSLLLVWDREIPNNKSYEFVAHEESKLLGFMPVRFWWLLALAGIGAVALSGQRRRDLSTAAQRGLLLWLGLYIALLGGAVILFFVTARYRLPLWPALAVLAGGGGAALLDALRGHSAPWLKTPHSKISAAVFALGLATLSLVNWLQVPPIEPHRDYFFRSLALFEKEHTEQALADAQRSVELEPSDPAAQFQLATVALALENLDLAEKHIRQAAVLSPEQPRVLNLLGVILEQRGDTPTAYQAYVRATELGPNYSPAWTNAALLELRANALGRAAKGIERAEQLGDRSIALQCARAFLELKRGRSYMGRDILRGAIERDEALVTRLLDEHRRPLKLSRGEAQKDQAPSTEASGASADEP